MDERSLRTLHVRRKRRIHGSAQAELIRRLKINHQQWNIAFKVKRTRGDRAVRGIHAGGLEKAQEGDYREIAIRAKQ